MGIPAVLGQKAAKAMWNEIAGTVGAPATTTDDIRRELNALSALVGVILNQLEDLAEGPEGAASDVEVAVLGRRRKRLLEMLISETPVAPEQLQEAAAAARWQLPRRLAVVAMAAPLPAVGRPMLSPEILTDFDRSIPLLIVPDPGSAAQVRALVNGLGKHRAAVGPVVEPGGASRSLRWARRTLDLMHRGVIENDGIVWCGDHLSTIAIFQDPDLVTALADRLLTPLAGLREAQRELLAETLLAWLQLNMSANEVAGRLHIHPQTVRHRLRHLGQLFGDSLRNPELRFDLEIALRADRARRMSRPSPAATPVRRSA
jgi:DNA-binding CsgD family transcriptional regulator